MFAKLKNLSIKHQNNKAWYYLLNNLRRIFPSFLFRHRLKSKLNYSAGCDPEYIQRRVNYYNRLETATKLPATTPSLSELKLGKSLKVYYFDSYEYSRYFDPTLRAAFIFGDMIHVPDVPALVKSRPIKGDNSNSVVLKLAKLRHFRYVKDVKEFQNKKPMLIFRGLVYQPHRLRFLEMYFNHPLCNIGQINNDVNPQYSVSKMTVDKHLDYKFILCLEGNDVASNLKWVMSSNSLAVMPKPTYETWFMEGLLIPNFHYVLLKDDYSDLEERMSYYCQHPDEALAIINNAHQFVNQFRNKQQEDLISLLVLKKYFEKTGQPVIF